MKALYHLPGGSNCIGYAVTSVAGRDRKREFLIVGVCEATASDGMVYIADGRLHRLNRPKKKNLIHLKVVGPGGEAVTALLRDGTAADSDVRAALDAMFGQKSDQESNV